MTEKFSLLLLSLLIGGSLALSGSVFAKDAYSTDRNATKEMISALITDIREKCKMTDEEIIKEGLTQMDVKKVRDFCGLSDKEISKILKRKIENTGNKKAKSEEGGDVGTLSYGCWDVYYYKGIPNYSDLGLSSATCSWHDYDKPYSCKVEGGVACLWGCNNTDSVLGWHTKWFQSTTALENEILPKGYRRLGDQYGGDYGRSISYGYRWQVHSIGGGWWHSEGPEPDPAFNWYAFLRGWWPVEVQVWHTNC